MKEIFERLVKKAKEIENKCKKEPIETIHNNYMDEYYYLGVNYKLLQD